MAKITANEAVRVLEFKLTLAESGLGSYLNRVDRVEGTSADTIEVEVLTSNVEAFKLAIKALKK